VRIRLTIVEWLVVIAILAIFATIAWDWFTGYRGEQAGAAAAEADLTAGILGQKTGGLIRGWRRDVPRLSKERYGIEVEQVYGCVASSYQCGFVSAYNKRMNARIAELKPDFSLQRMYEEGHKAWLAEHERPADSLERSDDS
jgi:hypothetical protein